MTSLLALTDDSLPSADCCIPVSLQQGATVSPKIFANLRYRRASVYSRRSAAIRRLVFCVCCASTSINSLEEQSAVHFRCWRNAALGDVAVQAPLGLRLV